MNNYKSLIIALILLLIPQWAVAVTLGRGPSTELQRENKNHEMVSMYDIYIKNEAGGTIEVKTDLGTSEIVGKVLRPTNHLSYRGYTASKWIGTGEVAATAVNAMHINVGITQEVLTTKEGTREETFGIVFSIIPKEFYTPPKNYNSFLSPNSSIQTNIRGGTAIFGGGYAPFTGSKVGTMDAGGEFYPLKEGYVPQIGDLIVIKVKRPRRYPEEIVFENRFGGLISLKYPGEDPKYIGQVLQPVLGLGRFMGTPFTEVGRIRANHAGVICISTSPQGGTSGFQIIPTHHAMSPEMGGARYLTQWMVIGPVSALDPSFESVAPFFNHYINPNYRNDDLEQPDWWERLLNRFLIQVRIKEGDWELPPSYSLGSNMKKPLVRWAHSAFKNVTHIRILFPVYPRKRIPQPS